MVIGVLQCVLVVPMFADRLGDPDLQTRVLDLLIDLVTAGLTPRPAD
ncbi:hypothetical protein ACBI99_36590 [Nonomuraea sp. ATR24]|nr:hypothetical protein [Nonomuraea ceibae]